MIFINRFGAIILALIIAAVSCLGIQKGYSYVQSSCLIFESERSDEQITESEYIVFGTAADSFPLSHINHNFNKEDCRYITDIVLNDNDYSSQIDLVYAKNIAKAMGVQLRVAYIPRGELVDSLENGMVDFISSFALEEDSSSLSSSSVYHTLKPVLVFGESGADKLSKVKSVRVYSDSKLESITDKSKLNNATWQKVSTYNNLVFGLNENTAYLTEISCVSEGSNYKTLDVIDSDSAQCRFIYRSENIKVGNAIEEAISRVEQSNKTLAVIEQKSNTSEDDSDGSKTDGFKREDVFRSFSGNNFKNGSEVFSGENDTLFIVSGNKLYHYDSSMNIIKTYEDYMVGDEAFALGGKIYTIDEEDESVCRVLDLSTGNTSTVSLNIKRFWFKSGSFHKARKLLKGKDGIITYEDFLDLVGMFSNGQLSLVEDGYLWKTWNSTIKKHLLRYDMKKNQTEKYTNYFTFMGVSGFSYNVYDGKAYCVSGKSMYCYDFKGDPKIIATEESINSVINYILDSDGVFYLISKSDGIFKIYRWEINGFCDELYSCEEELTNIYEYGSHIIVYSNNAFFAIDKNTGKVVERREINK